ncbi:MAG: RagB/SusD family nutrient uptake outer membrane protein, partial [Ferruginibacter sp.]
MKQLKNILLLLLVSTCTGGCKKYLDEKSDKSLVVPASVTDFQGILDDAYSMNLTSTSSLPESSSDDFFLTTDYYNNNNENSRAVYTWSLKEYTFQNDWSFGYQVIYNANVCIVGIATVPQTTQNQLQWNNVKGSALFFRAFTNLNLVSEFAKAYDKGSAASDRGIVLRTGTDFNVKSVRATVQDSYQSVINDAREAIAYLPDHPLIKLRPCKSAAYGLLARTFFSMREYDSALVYANLYLQADSVLLDYNTLDSASSTPFPRFDNPETIFYTEMNGSFVLEGTYQAFIDTTLYSSYNAAD